MSNEIFENEAMEEFMLEVHVDEVFRSLCRIVNLFTSTRTRMIKLVACQEANRNDGIVTISMMASLEQLEKLKSKIERIIEVELVEVISKK